MQLSYDRYLDQILGGWIGKSIGGAIGARFEGYKGWIDLDPDKMFPDTMPPNDDLDLQVLWLKVLEERGAAITSDDLAEAWLDGCWYPFNEYGIFRRNWRLGIHPPMSGKFTNQFWETGEGCPIRAEIWGYTFPGAPDLAAAYTEMDGVLDHSEQSVGAEKMLAAMSSMAFFVPDVRRLAAMFIHYLPVGTPIERLTRAAFQAYDEGLSLRDARDRLMALEGNPEACDAQINIPFTFLGLLYGGNDLEKVLLSALACGYDTDCTLASAAALVGQILGAKRIPELLKRPVGDELVMGIQYRRPEMTLTALARDTARVGVLLSRQLCTGVEITDAVTLAPFPPEAVVAPTRMRVAYSGLPAAAPGEAVQVLVKIEGKAPSTTTLRVSGPQGWIITPSAATVDETHREIVITLTAPVDIETWPMKNIFSAALDSAPKLSCTFGIAGAGLWKFLGIYYDELPEAGNRLQEMRRFNQHFVSLSRQYLPEPALDVDGLFAEWSRKLGRPAVVPSYEHEVDITRLVGLQGPLCAYLARTIIVPEECNAYLVIGNTDGYRLYLNNELVAEMDESTYWAPFNNSVPVHLQPGPNHLLLKLLCRGSQVRFTLGLRQNTGHAGGMNCEDWMVDLSDLVG